MVRTVVVSIDDKVEVCPYCYHPLSVEYKAQLMDSANNVLNKEVEEHVAKLGKSFFEEYEFNKATYEGLDAVLATEIEIKKPNQRNCVI